MIWLRRLLIVAVLAGVGSVVGAAVGLRAAILPNMAHFPFLAERVPLPHHVPEHAGGVALRFAMVQDVLTERFARHGPAYYEARLQLDEGRLAALAADDPARLPLLDDLGVDRERLGRSDAAIADLRGKLEDQRRRGIGGRNLYTTYANLGTFLIHASIARAMAGDSAARDRFREGVELIRESVRVNPEAHFGRERWQLAIAEFLLAAMADPHLLMTFDFLGNRYDLPVDAILYDRDLSMYGRAADVNFSRWRALDELPEFLDPRIVADDPALWPRLAPIRRRITRVGAEAGWDEVAVPSHREAVPFDEPTLGIVGMWRQGGGANPHFALALGETMLRVGQRILAWNAFERADRLADRAWPDPAIADSLRAHCRDRRRAIERTFAERAEDPPRRLEVGPPHPEDTPDHLRARFDAELKFGEAYRARYQDFERGQIARGVAVDDPRFDADFVEGPTPIASPVGPEEWFVGIPPARLESYARDYGFARSVFGAGVAAMLGALGFRLKDAVARRTRRPAVSPAA